MIFERPRTAPFTPQSYRDYKTSSVNLFAPVPNERSSNSLAKGPALPWETRPPADAVMTPADADLYAQSQPAAPSKPPGPDLGSTAGSVTGGVAGNAAADSLFGGGAAASGSTASMATITVPAGEAIPAGYTAVGTAANGGTLAAPSATAGIGMLPLAAGVAGTIATLAGRDWSNKQGGPVKTGWAVANSMNPINQAAEAIGNFDKVISGERIDDSTAIGLALPTFGASLLYNPLFGRGGMFGSSKGKEQVARDRHRHNWEKKGFTTDYKMTLDDGTILDLGKDGPDQYNYDPTKASAEQGIGWLNPIAYMITGGAKNYGQFAAQLYNQIDPTGDMDLNQFRDKVLLMLKKWGFTPSQARAFFEQQVKEGKLDQNTANAFFASQDSLRPGGGPQNLTKPAPPDRAQPMPKPAAPLTVGGGTKPIPGPLTPKPASPFGVSR